MNKFENLEEFMNDFEIDTVKSAIDALEDGEFLGKIGISQDEAEELHFDANNEISQSFKIKEI